MAFKKGNVPWNKGKKGLQTAWNKGLHIQTNTGRTHFKKGDITWCNGKTKENCKGLKKISERMKKNNPMKRLEVREKVSQANKGRHFSPKTEFKNGQTGERCINWLGGISFEPYSPEFNKQLKEMIRQRDNFTCQFPSCNLQENGRALDIHHIDYDKKNTNPKNLISLCQEHNTKVNFNRKYWTNYFQNIILICQTRK